MLKRLQSIKMMIHKDFKRRVQLLENTFRTLILFGNPSRGPFKISQTKNMFYHCHLSSGKEKITGYCEPLRLGATAATVNNGFSTVTRPGNISLECRIDILEATEERFKWLEKLCKSR